MAVHRRVGQYTEGWGSSQRGGAVHRGVEQYTEGWGSSQRSGAVHRGVGQFTEGWGSTHMPQHHSDPSSIMTQLLSLIQCQVRSDNKINRLEV